MTASVSVGPAHDFTIDVDQSVLDDLQERLRRSRTFDWSTGWEAGTPSDFIRRIVEYWRDEFDWRRVEAMMNELPNYQARVTTDAAEWDLHFAHVVGKGPEPIPLLFTHGWPGSFWEVHKIIGPLTDPVAYGGDARDSFTVVAPSLPGYGFSSAPASAALDTVAIADVFHSLMVDVLGYPQFVAQGGDWGAFVTSDLAARHSAVRAIHLNLFVSRSSVAATPGDTEYRRKRASWFQAEGAYAHIQGTKPATLSHALADSPTGLASWLGEKFSSWIDGDIDDVLGLDEVLTHTMLYWINGSIGPSMQLYWEQARMNHARDRRGRVETPTAFAAFPSEFSMAPREIADQSFNVVRYTEFARGGHFPALERPQDLVDDVREFFRAYR